MLKQSTPVPLSKRIGRTIETASMTGLRGYFTIGERLFPARAAQDAVKLWMRVPPAPPPAKRDRGLMAGEPLSIEVNGRPIHAMSWGEGPTCSARMAGTPGGSSTACTFPD